MVATVSASSRQAKQTQWIRMNRLLDGQTDRHMGRWVGNNKCCWGISVEMSYTFLHFTLPPMNILILMILQLHKGPAPTTSKGSLIREPSWNFWKQQTWELWFGLGFRIALETANKKWGRDVSMLGFVNNKQLLKNSICGDPLSQNLLSLLFYALLCSQTAFTKKKVLSRSTQQKTLSKFWEQRWMEKVDMAKT